MFIVSIPYCNYRVFRCIESYGSTYVVRDEVHIWLQERGSSYRFIIGPDIGTKALLVDRRVDALVFKLTWC
jgi:hypothetical protein